MDKEKRVETLAVPVKDAARSLGIGKTKLYELIGAGELETVHIGRRRLVKADSIRRLAGDVRAAA